MSYTRPTPSTDSATMLRRNLRHMLRYPSLTVLLARHAGRLPAAVRRTCSAARWAPGSAAWQAAAPSTSTTSCPASC